MRAGAGIPPSIYFPSKTRPQPDLCPDLRGLPPSPAAGRVTGWGRTPTGTPPPHRHQPRDSLRGPDVPQPPWARLGKTPPPPSAGACWDKFPETPESPEERGARPGLQTPCSD
ncbi:unnamed protein product [Gadus morhua 'NCC']